MKPAKQCIVCDVKLGDKDIIELSREGARCCCLLVRFVLIVL